MLIIDPCSTVASAETDPDFLAVRSSPCTDDVSHMPSQPVACVVLRLAAVIVLRFSLRERERESIKCAYRGRDQLVQRTALERCINPATAASAVCRPPVTFPSAETCVCVCVNNLPMVVT